MRTTVDLPGDLLRAAKAAAAARGETLKEFLRRAVAHELGSTGGPPAGARVRLPLVKSSRPGAADITNADIEAILAEDEAKRQQHS